MVLYFDDISLAFGFSTLVSIVKNDQHKKLYNMDLIQIIFKKLLYIVVGSWRNHPIHFLSNFSNGVHRYELKNVDRRDLDAMFNRNSFTNVDHTEISETLATTTTTFAGQSSSSELICSRK